MNALVVYASRKGQARKVAARIGDVLEAAGHDVQVHEILGLPAGLDLERFDLAVVGSSVRYGRHSGAIADFVRAGRASLAGRATAFFSVCGSAMSRTAAGDGRAREQVDAFLAETEWRPDRIGVFAGAVPYTRYGPFTRWFMKRLERAAGRSTDTARDHEYTDWVAVERFAAGLAPGLPSPRRATAAAPPATTVAVGP